MATSTRVAEEGAQKVAQVQNRAYANLARLIATYDGKRNLW